MATSDQLFVDSNYFVSLFNPDDTRYQHAFTRSKQLESAQTPLVISNLVFAEIVTVLSQRKGKEAGIEAGRYLLARSNIRVLHVDESIQEEAWKIFQQVQSKNISFVDCSIIAAMKTENISTLLTFDITDFSALQKQYRFSLYKD